jgi:hypothetical protein
LAKRFGPLAEAEFKRAIQLAPKSIPVRLAFVRFLTAHSPEVLAEPYYGQVCEQLNSILALEPDNKDAQQLAIEWGVMGDPACFPEPATVTATPPSTRPVASATLRPTQSPVPTASPQPTALPQLTASPAPTAMPTPLPAAGARGLCGSGAVALLIAGLALCARMILVHV